MKQLKNTSEICYIIIIIIIMFSTKYSNDILHIWAVTDSDSAALNNKTFWCNSKELKKNCECTLWSNWLSKLDAQVSRHLLMPPPKNPQVLCCILLHFECKLFSAKSSKVVHNCNQLIDCCFWYQNHNVQHTNIIPALDVTWPHYIYFLHHILPPQHQS